MQHTVESLRAFEESIREDYLAGRATGAVHLSRGNEAQLIEIFKNIRPCDWVFSNYRSHYHALLRGLPEEWVRSEIRAGRSISLNNKEAGFFTSSIVGGCLPIAVGAALAIKKDEYNKSHVWCFVGDMAASCGTFNDCWKYSLFHELPITFVVEDNGWSTNTPTAQPWNGHFPVDGTKVIRYQYEREWPHSGFKL